MTCNDCIESELTKSLHKIKKTAVSRDYEGTRSVSRTMWYKQKRAKVDLNSAPFDFGHAKKSASKCS